MTLMMANKQDNFTIVTLRERPGINEVFFKQKERIWPEFMFHDVYADKLWSYVYTVFEDFQLYLLNDKQEPIAVGQTMPLVWDGRMEDFPVGWADSLVRGTNDYEAGRKPNTLAALEIAIQPEYRRMGVSYRMIQAIRDLAEKHSFQAVIVAVRPSLKSLYPITPMERYVRWRRDDGAPFDPWLRAHWRSGAEILKMAHPSMVVEATVAEWQEWTGLQFPESGEYVIQDALTPIQIDREMDLGRYIEPNVWVHHPITTERRIKNEQSKI
jgi:GNAT superfamily N-acetyltransferase